MSTKFAPITQKLMNSYPLWSSIRNDEQANGAQYLNALGIPLQDLQEQLVKQGFNNTIPFADVTDLDLLYKFLLPKTFEFDLANNDQLNPIYDEPTVTGIINAVSYDVQLADNNDIESFWYTSIPNRLTAATFPVTNIVTDTMAVNMYGVLASITQDQSPYTTPLTLDRPFTRLWIQAVGGQKYIGIDENGIVFRATVVITGMTRQGSIETETLIFLHDDVQPTRKEWQSISKVEIFDIEPSTVTIRLCAHRFRRNQTPIIQPPRDFYNLATSAESKQDMDTFYELGIDGANNSTIKVQTWQVDDIRIRMNGFTDLDVTRSFEIHNLSDVAITTANDIAVQPFSNRLWVVDNTKLYVFDNELTLPDMSVMTKKVNGAMSVMNFSNYHIAPGDSFTIECFWQRQIMDIAKHRVWVQYPDGSLHNVFGGSFSSYDPTAYIFNGPNDRYLEHTSTYTLATPGDYIFNLEAVYFNGTREIDQRILSVDTKVALAQFDFTSIAPGGILRGVDFDSDHNLWILVDTSGTFTKMKITFAYDVMLIDYQNKIIFFKEQYDQVRVD